MERNISFKVQHQCPQCGAPLFLDEADRFFVCSFCHVRACIQQKGFSRYYLSPHKDLDPETGLTFLPYWRFKGVTYTCTPEGLTHRFQDLSWLALAQRLPAIPYSLGFRSQALPLKRVSERIAGRFIRPLDFRKSFFQEKSETGPAFCQEIGEMRSLIFAPFFEQGGLIHDGVLNQALGPSTGLPDLDSFRPEEETRILSGLCPDCGWDLEGQSDSLALVCRNCHTLWQPRDQALGRIRFRAVPVPGPDQVLIPFWQIQGRLAGLANMSELFDLANLPMAARRNQVPAFWAPAFKIRPEVFLRLCRQLTLAQPELVLEKRIQANPHLPVTLPATEAVQSIRVTLASLARPLKEQFDRIAGSEIKPESATLIFLPFADQTHEYLNPELGIAINRNLLRLSGNL